MYATGIDGNNIMKDPIIEKLWQTKDQIAKSCDYDVNKLAAMLRKKEKKHGRLVNRSKSSKTQK